jgi:hypothetical protein
VVVTGASFVATLAGSCGRRGGRNVAEVAAVASSRKDAIADVAATPTARRSVSVETTETTAETSMSADLTTIEVAEAATADVAKTAPVATAIEAEEKVPVDSVEVAVTITTRRYAAMEISEVALAQ